MSEVLVKNSYNMMVALFRIKAMIFKDPDQPIKNCQDILNDILKKIDEEDTGLPVEL